MCALYTAEPEITLESPHSQMYYAVGDLHEVGQLVYFRSPAPVAIEIHLGKNDHLRGTQALTNALVFGDNGEGF